MAHAIKIDLEDIFGPAIDIYTRAQAIEDAVLVDVSEKAAEAGFKVPVALTRALWDIIDRHQEDQDTMGHLWDVLWMASLAARRGGSDPILFQLLLRHGRKQRATLKMHSGPGDEAEHVITIMLPEED